MIVIKSANFFLAAFKRQYVKNFVDGLKLNYLDFYCEAKELKMLNASIVYYHGTTLRQNSIYDLISKRMVWRCNTAELVGDSI